nr:GNAT family N-acetyltransferase [Bacteroidota bacterium]
MIIRSKQLILKSIEKADDASPEIASNPEVSKYLTEKWMYPEGMPDTLTFSIEFEGKTVGQVALKSIRWYNRKAEMSLFLDPALQGKSLGTRALEAIMKHAFFDMNFVRLEAEVIEYNKPAIRVAEKLQFTREGLLREAKYHNGKYFNIIRYGILKREFEAYLNEKEYNETSDS